MSRRRIVIVGGGVAGWMSAATLARALGSERFAIDLVEIGGPDQSLGPFGPALAARPEFLPFAARLGLSHERLLAEAHGAGSLGTALTGWSAPGRSWFLPHGDTGAPIGSVAFHHLVERSRRAGKPARLADHSMAAIAARLDRFAPPSSDPRSVLSTYEYGLNLDRDALASLFRVEAEKDGARCAAAPFRHAILAGDGSIEAVELEGGEELGGDLFLDCTGAKALLVQGALDTGSVDWRRWLPCDRAIEGHTDETAPPPFAHVEAHQGGWRQGTPMGHGCGEVLVFRGEVLVFRGEFMDADAPAIPFKSGRSERAWNRNCIAIGAAAGMLEPLHGLGLHLVQAALQRLIALFPGDNGSPVEAREYNRLTVSEMERARDFLILHYKTNGRVGEPFWDACRAMEVPEPLAHKIAVYESRGRVPMYDDEVFDRPDWVALLDEQGIRPRRYDPLADAVPIERIDQHLGRIRQAMLAAAQTLPFHGDYLGQAAR